MHLVDHAREVRDHMKSSPGTYAREFEPSPDFVIMSFRRVLHPGCSGTRRRASEDGWRQGVSGPHPHRRSRFCGRSSACSRRPSPRAHVRCMSSVVSSTGGSATMSNRLGDEGGLDNAVKHYNAAVRSLGLACSCRPISSSSMASRAESTRRTNRAETAPLQAPELVEPGQQLRASTPLRWDSAGKLEPERVDPSVARGESARCLLRGCSPSVRGRGPGQPDARRRHRREREAHGDVDPSSRGSIVVPSSGQVFALTAARPTTGSGKRPSGPRRWSSVSTRPSDAASSVSPQPPSRESLTDLSRQRSTTSLSRLARHSSTMGLTISCSPRRRRAPRRLSSR